MIRMYYMAQDSGGGEGSPPAGYKPLTPSQRREWNDMLDHLQSEGTAGNKDLDATDKNAGASAIDKYRKENPDSTISPDMVSHVQYEHQQLRSGKSFPGMSDEQLGFVRSQLNPEFMNRKVDSSGKFGSDTSRMYYPTFKSGDDNYGADMSKLFSEENISKGKGEKAGSNTIPLPNYSDTSSRQNYLKSWSKKYGDLEGRGDTVLKLNEVPRGGSDTMKNISVKTAKQYGIDPALLYSSAMEEGASGLFKDKSGLDTKHRKPGEAGYEDNYGDKQYPINGGQSFGFQTFNQRFPDLVQKGLLPKSFEEKFRKKDGSISEGKVEAANDFKTVEDAMQAKGAMMKYGENYVEDFAKKHNIKLSDEAKEFFTLAWFNGGEGGVNRMVDYDKKGYLKDDSFLKKRPEEEEKVKGTKDDVWGHSTRRINMRDNLKAENLF